MAGTTSVCSNFFYKRNSYKTGWIDLTSLLKTFEGLALLGNLEDVSPESVLNKNIEVDGDCKSSFAFCQPELKSIVRCC